MGRPRKELTPTEEVTDSGVHPLAGMYWKGNTFIPGYGHVRGKATTVQIVAFESVSVDDVRDWLSKEDVHTAWEKAHQRKNLATT
jgi:hypothetical protein